MTNREKIAHILRRFGLGVCQSELDRLEPLGPDKAFEQLIDYEDTDEQFPYSPWEFAFQKDGRVQLDPSRFAMWWVARLMLSQRPVQEKLTVFWHNHFAVSASKVENGPMMEAHLSVLRRHANGKFIDLLKEITIDPAMLRWLDNDQNLRGKPNENFAREVMELFTMGIGNYSEADVKELSRAMTGWSVRSLLNRDGRRIPIEQQIRENMAMDYPVVAAIYTPALHDDLPKTLLGVTENFSVESALTFLASRKETAKYMSKKFWEFFAYENPAQNIIDRMAKVFEQSKGDTKSMLRSIYRSKEFWSERCVNHMVKSPLDIVIGTIRALDLREPFLQARAKDARFDTPAPDNLVGVCGFAFGAMRKMGMMLLYPPDVAGWNWGQSWISAGAMLERMQFALQVFGSRRGIRPASEILRQRLLAKSLTKNDQLADAVLQVFDAKLSPEKKQLLIATADQSGGIAALQKEQSGALLLANMVRLLFAAPEFHLC